MVSCAYMVRIRGSVEMGWKMMRARVLDDEEREAREARRARDVKGRKHEKKRKRKGERGVEDGGEEGRL